MSDTVTPTINGKTGYELEKLEAYLDGATLVKNSGRGFWKCDATLSIFGVDYKHSTKSFTFNPSKWAKLVSDALQNGLRRPAMKLVFENDGNPLRVWIISDAEMKDYIRLLELEENDVRDNA